MPKPESTRLILQCYPGVAATIAEYAKERGLSVADAKNHVASALGFIDACEQRGDKLYYVPDFYQQQRHFSYWQGEDMQLLARPFKLADFGNTISEEPVPTKFNLLDRAYASLEAYRRTHRVSNEVALARGTIVLVLISLGDLSVYKGSTMRQLVIK